MKSLAYFLSFGLMVFSSCLPTVDHSAVTGEWRDLFNGTDLSGWTKMGDFDVNIEEGVLTISDDASMSGGWLLTEESFENFILEADFKVTPGNNSGIAIRYNDAMEGHPAVTAYEVNIDHNQDQQNPTGSIFNVARAQWLQSTDEKGWNQIRIEANGDHLKVIMYDTVVTEVHARRAFVGKIGLQAHGGKKQHEAAFRNIRIKPLATTEYLGPMMEDYLRSTIKRPLEVFPGMNSLDAWTQVGDGSWKIDDGVIHGYSGEEGGFLVSKAAYQNFYLKFKFKIQKEHNSGIFIRKDPASEEVTIENAIECNIYDHNGYTHVWSTGSIATHSRAWSNMVDYDDWNLMEICAFEDQVSMFVNGLKSTETHLPAKFNNKGNICIQGGIQVFAEDQGPSSIMIKDMMIKDMDGIPFLGY